MWVWLSHPTVQAVLAVAILIAVVYAGIQAVMALRPTTSKADSSVDDLSRNFEEMRFEGDISDEELRSIKAVLGKTQSTRPNEDGG